MAEEVYRVEVNVEVKDKYSAELTAAGREVTAFERKAKRTERQLDRMNRSRWRLALHAVDRASHVIRRVGMFADRMFRRGYRIAIRAVDMFTSPLRSIMRGATSMLGMLGIVGGVGAGFVLPIKMQVERQNVTTAFEVLLGSREAAQQRLDELVEFASQTPYAREDIFEASRVLEVFTKGALSTGSGLKMVGDIAAGTQQEFTDVALWVGRLYDAMSAGRPIGEMTARLQEMGAISGEQRARLEELADSGKDISRIWPSVTKEFSRFDGLMEKMSDNLGNLLLGVKSFVMNSMVMPWGQGLNDVLAPLLSDFRKWRGENSDLLDDMSEGIRNAGKNFAGFFADILRSVGGNFDELIRMPEFQEADFSGKFKIAWDKVITQPLTEWWNSGGKEKVDQIMANMGSAIGSGLNTLISGMLGVAVEGDDGGSVYQQIGTSAGKNFLQGFLEGFDAGEIAKKLGEALKNIQPTFLGGNTESLGGSALALMFDAWLLTKLGGLFRGPGKLAKGGWNLGKTVLGWFGVGKGKGKGPTPPAPRPTPPTTGQRVPIYGPRGEVIHTVGTNRPSAPSGKVTSGALSFFSNAPFGKGTTSALKRIPLLGPLLNLTGIATATPEERPGAIGGATGGILGSLIGATIGSVIPGAGTAIAGVAGGILGSLGGEKLGSWFSDNFTGIKETISETIFDSGWWSEKWDGVKDWTSEKLSDTAEWWENVKQTASDTLFSADWWLEQVGFVFGYLEGSIFNGEWWSERWETVKSLTEGTMFDLEWWSTKWEEVKGWTAEKWEEAAEIWEAAKTKIGETIFSGDWWLEKWEGVKGWTQEKWDEAASVWESIRSKISETVFSKEWWSGKWESVKGWAASAWEGIKGMASDLGASFQRGRSAGRASAYADGGYINRPHLGLVGEAGPEMIIPLSPSRRSRGIDLLMSAGRMLGVRPYADGGLVGGGFPRPVGSQKLSLRALIDSIVVNINMNVEGNEQIDTKSLVKEIADEVGYEIAKKVEEVLVNMVATSS